MKELILRLDEEMLGKARRRAAERNLSVAAFITDLLRRELRRDDEYEAAYRAWQARKPFLIKGSAQYPKREALYDRALLRRH